MNIHRSVIEITCKCVICGYKFNKLLYVFHTFVPKSYIILVLIQLCVIYLYFHLIWYKLLVLFIFALFNLF